MKKILTFAILLCIMITLMIPKITTKADVLYDYGYTSIPFELTFDIDGVTFTLDMITHESNPTDVFSPSLYRVDSGNSAITWDYLSDGEDCYYWFREEFGYSGSKLFIMSAVDDVYLTFNDLCITRNELLDYTPWLDDMLAYINYEISILYLDENYQLQTTTLRGTTQTPSVNLMHPDIANQLEQYSTNGQILIDKMDLHIIPSAGWRSREEFHLYVPVYGIINPSAGDDYYRPFSMRDFLFDYDFTMPSFDGGSWLATAVGGFLDTPIFGFISIGSLLLVVVAIPLVISLLKFFAGG